MIGTLSAVACACLVIGMVAGFWLSDLFRTRHEHAMQELADQAQELMNRFGMKPSSSLTSTTAPTGGNTKPAP